jgi:MoaA/NifB/PqqE/SkfB family radical SAM enzyme
METKITAEKLLQIIGDRDVYIYAANLEGVGFSRMLKRHGISITGFIDDRWYRDSKKEGFPVIKPDQFIESNENMFVIIATKHREYKKLGVKLCESLGLVFEKDFLHGSNLCNFYPTIEPIGKCNLKCVTCNMALPDANKGKGNMHPFAYERVLDKLITDLPLVSGVSLFLWGEPLMHPQLDEFIKITKERGLTCDISTNLNFGKHLDKVLEAAPDILSIACSGRGDMYEKTHTGGNYRAFSENLTRVAEFMRDGSSDVTVRFFYHMYKHNLNEDFNYYEQFCADNNFFFFPIYANLFPEAVFNLVTKGEALPEPMVKAQEYLLFDLDDHLEYAKAEKEKYCPFMQVFPTVRWDGSVVHCSNMEQPVLTDAYLEHSWDELLEMREEEKRKTCAACMAHGLHRFFDAVNVKIVKDDDGVRSIVRL